MRVRGKAFSLLEVVVAIGVFALGIVVVIGLLAPIGRAVANNSDAEAASNVADLLKSELMRRVRGADSFAPVTLLFKSADAWSRETDSNIQNDPQTLFADRAGTTIGSYDSPVWDAPEVARFYEITVVRNSSLSPAANDETAVMLAYTARLRWPVVASGASANQQTLLVNGSIRR